MGHAKALNANLDTDCLVIRVPFGSPLLEEIYPPGHFGSEETIDLADKRPAWKLVGDRAIQHAQAVHRHIRRAALRLPEAAAVDIGFAIKEDTLTFQNILAIRLHVQKKVPEEELKRLSTVGLTDPNFSKVYIYLNDSLKPNAKLKQEVSEKYKTYPIAGIDVRNLTEQRFYGIDGEDLGYRRCLCGVPIDIVEARYFPSSGIFVEPPQSSAELSNDELLRTGRSKVNTLVGGISIGNSSGQAGTLGAIVWDRTDGRPCILGNWHVLAGSPGVTAGEPCYQPAFFDGGSEADVVAHLKRWHWGLRGDMAIAELDGTRDYASGEAIGLWHPIAGCLRPELNMKIRKWGRSTGFTEGFIDGIDLTTTIDYGGGQIRHFEGQFRIAPLERGKDVSQVGDSGSLVFTSVKVTDLEHRARELQRRIKELENGVSGAEAAPPPANRLKKGPNTRLWRDQVAEVVGQILNMSLSGDDSQREKAFCGGCC